MLQQAIVENVQREELNPLEEAAAYQQLIEDFALTHDDVAARVGQEPHHDHEHLATAAAPARDPAVPEGRVAAHGPRARAARHARPRVPGAARQARGRRRPVGARRSRRRSAPARARPPEVDARAAEPSCGRPGLLELEELLGDYLETRVRISMGPSRGKVEVDFATLEDLERIYRIVTEGRRPTG